MHKFAFVIGMRLNGYKQRNKKQQQEQQKRFVSKNKINDLLHGLSAI